MKTVKFLIEKLPSNYTAYSADYSILVTGDTVEQVQDEAASALREQCEYLGESVGQYKLEFTHE